MNVVIFLLLASLASPLPEILSSYFDLAFFFFFGGADIGAEQSLNVCFYFFMGLSSWPDSVSTPVSKISLARVSIMSGANFKTHSFHSV